LILQKISSAGGSNLSNGLNRTGHQNVHNTISASCMKEDVNCQFFHYEVLHVTHV